jgi:hypothetical protein
MGEKRSYDRIFRSAFWWYEKFGNVMPSLNKHDPDGPTDRYALSEIIRENRERERWARDRFSNATTQAVITKDSP